MPRRSPKHFDDALALAYATRVLAAVAERKKLRSFLRDFLTPSERAGLAQRLRVARLLLAGHSYRKIQSETGARFGTIIARDRWLRRRNPNYRRLLPLQHRRERKQRGFSDAFRPIPGSIKDLYQSLTGTSLW